MIRVDALTSGPHVPSARFRVRQYVPPLRELGIDVHERALPFSKYASPRRPRLGPVWTVAKLAVRAPEVARSRRADAVWLERELVPGRATLERFTGTPRVLDVDDAIWLLDARHDFSVAIARRCDAIIAGNAFIAERFMSVGVPISIVPTGVDTDIWRPDDKPDPSTSVVLGWTGSASTLPFLLAISESIAQVLRCRPDVRLRVVCDVPPRLEGVGTERVDWLRWTPQSEGTSVRGMDIGLLPQPDSTWSRGKCSLKMLQYMACGIPTVASPVGHAAELLATAKVGIAATDTRAWTDAMVALVDDARERHRMGACARIVAKTRFATPVIAERLAAVFRSATQ